MFGLDVRIMHRLLNMLGEQISVGEHVEDGQQRLGVVRGYPVALKRVDLRWYRTYFGRTIGFYRRPPFRVLQVAWPDPGGHFHWQEESDERHRQSQPQLWLKPDEHPEGAWTVDA